MLAVKVREVLMHAACMTPEEAMLTAVFYQGNRIPNANCERCNRLLKEDPDP